MAVEIDGINFGTTQGTVTFNGTAVNTFASWGPTQILAMIPAGATSGPLVVTAGGLTSAGAAFSIVPAPVLTGISPVAGLAGTALTLNGSGLSSCTTVSMGGAQVGSIPTATLIAATLPTAAPAGLIAASAICNGYQTNSVPFTVAPVPVITSVSPGSAYAGQTVPIEIYGINFGTGTPTVTFNGTAVTTFSYLSSTVIVPMVPVGATTGPIVVTVGGVSSAGASFTVIQPPTITSISPSSGTPGTPVTITGTNLSSCPNVLFGSIYSNITPSATSIATLVQTGAASASGGTVQVKLLCENFQTNSLAFTVLPAPPPAIASVTPSAIYDAQTSGSQQASITLTGTNFGTSGTITFNNEPPFNYTSSDGQTIVVSAFDANTGPMTVTTSGATSGSVPFTVAPAPTITSISPHSGQIGSTAQITGTNLAGVAGTTLAGCSTWMFNSTPVAISVGSSTSASGVVPTGAPNGPGTASVVCNGYRTNSVPFTIGTAYDHGSVALTVNGVTDSVPYGQSQNANSANVAASLITAVNADPNAFVNASPNGSTGITLTSRNPGVASTYNFSLIDNYDTYDFDNPSFTSTPLSGTLTGGSNATVTQSPVYSYSIPYPNTPTTGYDPNGNILSYADSVMGSWSFGYDSLNRLSTANVSSGSYMGANITGATLGWTYDAFGNRLTQTSNTGALPTGSTQFAGANNQATGTGLASNPTASTNTLQYDAAGNLTGMNGGIQNVYDAEGRLCATQSLTGGSVGYLYDAAGNRVAKGTIQPVMVNGQSTLSCDMTANGFTLTHQYLLGPSGEQMTELDANGAWVHTNVTANGSLFATFDNDNNGVHFYLTDWLGTRRVQTNYLGAVENTWTSLPFGDGLSSSAGVDPTEQHFTGKERDAESGLDYFGARYYASGMGRWTTPDWSAEASPVPYATMGDPQSLNLYAYVGNNPLSRADADGHCDWCKAVGSFAKSVGIGAAKYLYNSAATNPLIPNSAKEAGLGMNIAGGQTLATPNGVGENIGYYGTPVAMAATAIVTDAAFGGSVTVTAAPEAPMAVEPISTPSTSFISTPGGDVIPVPQGASGPSPVVNGAGNTTGMQYQGGSGGNGMDARTTGVRVMDPTPARGASPGYPDGYASYNNASGQTVNPQSGRTVPRSDPSAHQPLTPPQ